MYTCFVIRYTVQRLRDKRNKKGSLDSERNSENKKNQDEK